MKDFRPHYMIVMADNICLPEFAQEVYDMVDVWHC